MRNLIACLSAYLAFLCRMACVTPESLRRGRRGNLPPASGGIASY